LCRELGRLAETRASYEKALELALARQPEPRFLAERLAELKQKIGSAVDSSIA
jgi:predicted RNA polymerase sigma factor